MKIVNQLPDTRQPMPLGKVSIRWIHSRCCYQVYIGGKFALGCSGGSHEECERQIDLHYIR